MTEDEKLYMVMQELGIDYNLGITTWPEDSGYFDRSIKSKWLCGIPISDDEDDEYSIDYLNYTYGETALEAAEKALKIKEQKDEEI